MEHEKTRHREKRGKIREKKRKKDKESCLLAMMVAWKSCKRDGGGWKYKDSNKKI